MEVEEFELNAVTELGERRVIDIIRRRLDLMPNMPIPYGDDVSAVNIGKGKLAVLKTDMLVGKTDVPLGMNLLQAARKAVVMNVSDLAAKGVKPKALLASLGVPRNFNEKDVEQIGIGLNKGARDYGAYVLGGDTGEASDLIISCAVLGIGEKKHIMLRRGARPGDFVAVTGPFGKTSAGLNILLQKLLVPPKLKNCLVDSVLTPHARLDEGLALAKTGAVSAAIDSSDGLAWSLHEISRASGVGLEISNLPLADEAREFAKMCKFDPVELGLYGGEEYELAVTVKPSLWKKLSEKVPLIRIGVVTEEKTLVLKVGKKTLPIEARGWEHFKTNLAKSY